MRVKIPLQIIELEDENFHLLVTGVFTDGSRVNWIIDTGASKSVFDIKLTKQYEKLDTQTEEIHSAGIGTNPLETSLARLKSFHLGKLKIQSPKMAILDLTHINELYTKAVQIKIAGLLGGDFLVKYEAMIDYKRKKIILKG